MLQTPSLYVPTAAVSRSAADALIQAAIKSASDLGIDISVAIVDAGGATKAFSRTDGAAFLTVDAAVNKAWSAASFGYPTHTWNEYMSDPKLAPLSNLPRMLPVGGGYPLFAEGRLVGGIGISGGSYAQDQDIAAAALLAVGFSLR
ncbi:GlcG/HbpS family heme-binding protein [Burkholderia catarinensis]|uniref:GlcG/HbpS family heme-binding protein n=1 Tax=Burkholderia catarinensis TaxID=1108140 RepID=UPI00091EF86F|nr:heme-binding protein [Burkholderia catarinensis]KAG8152947.1 hypothetical protein BFF94_013715 [Burkholderia catarinensis]